MISGIEAINFYGGITYLDVETLFKSRGLDLARFSNLMMEKKSVGLPCEDPVTNGVNAAKPIIDQLSEEDKNKIEMVITATESGIDFGKSISTYIHKYLDLPRSCRLFEVKQACYAGTAALHMANAFVASGVSPGAKALVIATDTARGAAKLTYAEPSQGVGAIAMLVSDQPQVFEIDFGANGIYGYEVFDTCRPEASIETGDPDLSLLSYLDCVENAYQNYANRVEGADFLETFDYLAFHTPFAGMVKGAHKTLIRKLYKMDPDQIQQDFETRVVPSLKYCVEVGNVYSATVYLALLGLIDNASVDDSKRVGLFSYGSGCSSEFYSGLINQESQQVTQSYQNWERLQDRYELNMEEYDRLVDLNVEWMFGIREKEIDIADYQHIFEDKIQGKGLLVLEAIKGYYRNYVWS